VQQWRKERRERRQLLGWRQKSREWRVNIAADPCQKNQSIPYARVPHEVKADIDQPSLAPQTIKKEQPRRRLEQQMIVKSGAANFVVTVGTYVLKPNQNKKEKEVCSEPEQTNRTNTRL